MTTDARIAEIAACSVVRAVLREVLDPETAHRMARTVVAEVRPVIYREAAEYVRQTHVAPAAATASDVVMAGIQSAAAVLEHRAATLARRDEETRDA